MQTLAIGAKQSCAVEWPNKKWRWRLENQADDPTLYMQ